MMAELPPFHTKTVFLTAAACDAQLEMPLPAFTQAVIDIATEHANILGIGFDRMIKDNAAWVLSRVSSVMKNYPACNEEYTMTTWITTLNRICSERYVRFDNARGETLGYVRTVWAAIDVDRRRPVNLLTLFPDGLPMPDIAKPDLTLGRIPRVENPDIIRQHRFLAADIDCNRHVNTNRYVEQVINQWSVDFYDIHRVERFDIVFHAEALYGEEVKVVSRQEENTGTVEIIAPDGRLCTQSQIVFSDR